MVAPLLKLPLEALLGPDNEAAPNGGTPAFLSRETLQLCFTTRKQIYKLKDLELALLRTFRKRDPQRRPSILRGALVRFVSKQVCSMAFISDTREEPAGQLMLLPQGFDRWVPSSCLSNTCTLSDDKQWAELGRDEVCALLQTVTPAMPSRREIAAACCRLSTGWLWMCQPRAFHAALAADPLAVEAQLEDPAAVAALLPCVEEPEAHSSGRPLTPAGAAASAARSAAAFRQKAQDGESDRLVVTIAGAQPSSAAAQQTEQQAEQPEQQEQRLPASPPWSAGTQPAVVSQGQQRQAQQQQQDGPVLKCQRTDSPSAGSGGQQQQQQQEMSLQHIVQPPAEAFRFGFGAEGGQPAPLQLLSPVLLLPPPPPHLPPPAHPVQPALQRTTTLQHPQQQHATQQQQQQQQQPLLGGRVQAPLWPVLKQSPTPGYAWMPAGGPLERGLMQAVHALTSSNPTEPRQLGDLGNQMLAMNFNYKKLCGKRTLTQCAHELYHRGLIVLYSQVVRKAKSYYFSALPKLA